MTDTRRSFLGKLLAATGLAAIADKLFGPAYAETPKQIKSGDWYHYTRVIGGQPEVTDSGGPHVLTEQNSNIQEYISGNTVIPMRPMDEMTQMEWLTQASGRPHGAAPWKNERCIPGHGPRLKRVPNFPDIEGWSGDPN